MKKNEILTTRELMDSLKLHPEKEVECRLLLPYGCCSTHYWRWDAEKQTFLHTRDWPYDELSEELVLKLWDGYSWRIDQII